MKIKEKLQYKSLSGKVKKHISFTADSKETTTAQIPMTNVIKQCEFSINSRTENNVNDVMNGRRQEQALKQ